MLEVNCHVLLCVLEIVEGELCLLVVLKALAVPEMIGCRLLHMLEAVDARVCLLEAL